MMTDSAHTTSVAHHKLNLTALNLFLARRFFKLKASDRTELFDTISYYLETFNLEETLEALANRRLKRQEMYGFMLHQWLVELRAGKSLMAVLSEWLPEDEASIIAVNARERKDRDGFIFAAKLADSKQKMLGAVVSNLAQPIVALALLFVVISLFTLSIIPQVVAGQDVSQWPWAGRGVVALSDFVANYSLFLPVFIIGLVVFVSWSLARIRIDQPFAGNIRRVLDYLPPYNIYKSLQAASFLMSLSSLLQAGTELRTAIMQLLKTSSPYLSYYLELMDLELRRGNYQIIAECGLFDPKVAGTLSDFMQLTQSFDEAVKRVGARSVDFALERVQRIAAILSAISGLLFVATLGFFMYGIAIALLSAYTQIGM